ncbi:uncharacterized protein LOC134187525 [Corticium candelabrum]|uniref:uncharacterized protein LOC134187525 n=1 Tax=Corticium candelabrum TaxID=121492 RepID=UPI002E26298B|nr:uncharacterized protein LOC134187525 [Corticium candelabrum]
MSRKLIRDGLELFDSLQHGNPTKKKELKKRTKSKARKSIKRLQTQQTSNTGTKTAHSNQKKGRTRKKTTGSRTSVASSKSAEDFLQENLTLLKKQNPFKQYKELIEKVTFRNTPRWHKPANVNITNEDKDETNISEATNDIDYDFNATL